MYHRFHLRLASLILVLVLSASAVQGAVSYLLIQGKFPDASSVTTTYKWKVNYTGSSLVTGQDLFFAVFGNPVLQSGITYKSGNNTHGLLTKDYGSFGYSPQQFYVNGIASALTQSASPFYYWNYQVAGGSGDNSGDNFADGVWTFAAADGAFSRQLEDGSFDAWTYGDYDAAPVTGSGNLPIAADFSGTQTLIGSGTGFTVYSIASAPEPNRSLLLLLSGIALAARRRRPFCSTC